MLGQYTPYSSEMFVQRPVIQMAPEYGGIVVSVPVRPKVPVKRGDLLFQMDVQPWQEKADILKPQVDIARRHYDDAVALVAADAQRQVLQQQRRDELAAVQAELDRAQYNVDHATIVAPADGYVANLQLRPGAFIVFSITAAAEVLRGVAAESGAALSEARALVEAQIDSLRRQSPIARSLSVQEADAFLAYLASRRELATRQLGVEAWLADWREAQAT